MELILKRISDLPLQDAASLTGTELVLVGNNGVNVLVPLSAVFADAQSQLSNVANLSVVTLANIQDANFTDTYVTYDLLAQAVQSLGILLTQSQQQALLLHLINYTNPHRVTAEQVGLGNVANLPLLTQADLTANNFGNKYITYNVLQAACEALGFKDLSNVANYPPTSLADIQNGVFGQTYLTYNLLSAAVQSLNIILSPMLRTEFLAHLTDYNNPHEVTAAQVGLGNVVNLPLLTTQDIAAKNTSLAAYVPYNLLEVAVASVFPILSAAEVAEFLAHLTDYNNPHEVTAEQVGLGKVANLPPITTSDINSSTPGDVYLTYNLLQQAIISVGCCSAVGLTIAASTPTYDSIPVTAAISSLAGISLNNMQVTFTYYPTNNPSASTSSSPQAYTNSPSVEYTIIGLKSNTSYTISATLTNTTNNSINISSNVIAVSTLAVVVAPTAPVAGANQCSFDIIGVGGSNTIVFDNTTVTGNGISIASNIATAESDGATCLMVTMKDPDANTTIRSLTPQIVYTPNSVGVIPNVGTTAPSLQFSKVATAFNPLGPTFVIAALNPANGGAYYNDMYNNHSWTEVNMVDNLGATLTFSDIALEYDPNSLSGGGIEGIVAAGVDANTGIVYYRDNFDSNVWTMLPNNSSTLPPSFSAVSLAFPLNVNRTIASALDPASGAIYFHDSYTNEVWTAASMTTSTGGVLNASSVSSTWDSSGTGGIAVVSVDSATQTVYLRPANGGASTAWQLLPTVSKNGNSLSFTHATTAYDTINGYLVVLGIDTTGNIYAWNNAGATWWTELPTTDSSGNSITFSSVSFAPDANDSNILREVAIEANTGLPYTRYNTSGSLWTAIPMPSTASTPAANPLTTITLATPLSTTPTSGETFQFIVNGVIVEQIIGNTLSYSNGVFTTTSPFATAPTAVIIGGSRSPVGVIGTGTLAPLTVATKTISQGVITEVYNEITGDGASVQIGLNNLYAGDQVIEFDGICTTKSIIITASLAFDIIGAGSASTTAFDSTTVTGSGISIANNIATAGNSGATCLIAPLDAVSGGAFSNLDCEISYILGGASVSSVGYHSGIGPGTSATEILYVDQNTGIIYYAQNSYNGITTGNTVPSPYNQNGAVQVSPAGLFFKQVSSALQGRLWTALEKNTGVIYYVYLPNTGISQSIQTWTPISTNGIFFVDAAMDAAGTEIAGVDNNGNLYYSPTGLIVSGYSQTNFGGGFAIYTGNLSFSFTQINMNGVTLTNVALGTQGPGLFGIFPVTNFIWYANGSSLNAYDYSGAYSSFGVISGNYSSVAECMYGQILLATDINTGVVYYQYDSNGSAGWSSGNWITLPNDGLFFTQIYAPGLGQMFIGVTDTGDAYYMLNNYTYTFNSSGYPTAVSGNPGGSWQLLNGPNHLQEYLYYIASPLSAAPSAGDVFQFVVNGTNIPMTIGSGLTYTSDYLGAYFSTATPFAAKPTSIIVSGSRGPVGIIGSGALQQLAPSNTTTSNNIVTEYFTGVPGTGNTLQIGLNNLYAGDQVVEFKGTVTDTSG
jgi:hypothetical protein